MQKLVERRNYVTRAWLLARSAELRERVRQIDADLHRPREPLTTDPTEAAIALENDELLKEIRAAALDEFEHIAVALQRLDLGKSVICTGCGDEIESERLAAARYNTRCADCASDARPCEA